MKKSYVIICASALAAIALVFLFERQHKAIKAKEAEVEALKSELSASQDNESSLKDQIFDRNQEMSIILDELASIAGRTSSLKMDVESGSASISQAQQIESSLDAIKERIASLEKSNSQISRRDKEFQTVIENFKKVVAEQEARISSLKKEIAEKNIRIADQQSTIENQYRTIGEQRESLQDLLISQAKSLYQAGADIESIADDAPSVSWKKNRQKVEEMTQTLYRKALDYYQKALDAGYEPAEEAIIAVQEKIR